MAKKISNFGNQLGQWIMSHPWLKLIALILAVLVWFYVKDEINRFNY